MTRAGVDRYAVVGNPVAHSLSPSIHALFARITGHDVSYERLLAPLDAFVETVERFRAEGGRGVNVTVPFKHEAYAWAARHGARAREASAVNTLRFDVDPETGRPSPFGENTDGIGLVRDIESRIGLPLAGASVLLVGAGGAAYGVVGPLLDAGVASLSVSNRTANRANALAEAFAGRDGVVPRAVAIDALRPGYDAIVNATSSGLAGEGPPLADDVFVAARLAYDMFYAPVPGVFLRQATHAGCPLVSDGLGMLVEQAAESFFVWRGVRPPTDTVYGAVRAELNDRATPHG